MPSLDRKVLAAGAFKVRDVACGGFLELPMRLALARQVEPFGSGVCAKLFDQRFAGGSGGAFRRPANGAVYALPVDH